MERSASLIQLLSSPAGKTDIDAMDNAADVLASSVRAYTAERRLIKYRSKLVVCWTVHGQVDVLSAHEARKRAYNRIRNTINSLIKPGQILEGRIRILG